MNIIFPSAGIGSRFSSVGHETPKPLIKIGGVSIIERAIYSLGANGNYYVIVSCLDKAQEQEIKDILSRNQLSGAVINLDHKTSGAPETCLAAESFVNLNEPLVICNNDHQTDWDFDSFAKFADYHNYDALVTTYNFKNIKIGQKSPYSHIKVDEYGLAVKFEEKLAISYLTLNGIFYWRKASDFFNSARLLLKNPHFVNGEKYISQTFNYLIDSGLRVSYYQMSDNEYISFGTPEDVANNIFKLK